MKKYWFKSLQEAQGYAEIHHGELVYVVIITEG